MKMATPQGHMETPLRGLEEQEVLPWSHLMHDLWTRDLPWSGARTPALKGAVLSATMPSDSAMGTIRGTSASRSAAASATDLTQLNLPTKSLTGSPGTL
jgi:hypothetical protein